MAAKRYPIEDVDEFVGPVILEKFRIILSIAYKFKRVEKDARELGAVLKDCLDIIDENETILENSYEKLKSAFEKLRDHVMRRVMTVKLAGQIQLRARELGTFFEYLAYSSATDNHDSHVR
jgi:hypothetical protein